MTDWLIAFAPLAIILSIGIFVQAAAGFAAGLLIVPALLWCGYTIPAAQCALLVATVPQNVSGVWSFRKEIESRSIVWPAIARILTLPIGVLVLLSMENLPAETIRQIVGAVVLLATVSIMTIRPKPRHRLHPIWAWLAFPTSGFLQGLVGMGGPAMVFWVQAHDWSTGRSRGFLFSMYLVSILPGLGILYWAFGDRIVVPGITAACSTPLLLAVTYFGLKFGTWLGRDRLRRVTLWLLFCLGISGLAAPWLGGAAQSTSPVHTATIPRD